MHPLASPCFAGVDNSGPSTSTPYPAPPPLSVDTTPHSNTITHPILSMSSTSPPIVQNTNSASPSPQPPNSRKRHRSTPPTSDSDPKGYSRNNQPHEPFAPTTARIPQKPSTIAQSRSSAEETTHSRPIGESHQRFLGEYKSTPHSYGGLSPSGQSTCMVSRTHGASPPQCSPQNQSHDNNYHLITHHGHTQRSS